MTSDIFLIIKYHDGLIVPTRTDQGKTGSEGPIRKYSSIWNKEMECGSNVVVGYLCGYGEYLLVTDMSIALSKLS